MRFAWLAAVALMVGVVLPTEGAIVTYELLVNESAGPVNVNPGDTVDVQIWATVTDNTHHAGTSDEIDLGLALYSLNILTSDGGVLAANSQFFSDTPANPDDEWIVTYHPMLFAFGNRARGNDVGGSVLGHGAGQTMPINTDFGGHTLAAERTLLASGLFLAGDAGQAMLSLDNPGANIVTSSEPDSYGVTNQDITFALSDGVLVNVVPEPGVAVILGIAGLALLGRRRSRAVVR